MGKPVLLDLPTSIFESILVHLASVRDKLALAAVCRSFANESLRSSVWRRFAIVRFERATSAVYAKVPLLTSKGDTLLVRIPRDGRRRAFSRDTRLSCVLRICLMQTRRIEVIDCPRAFPLLADSHFQRVEHFEVSDCDIICDDDCAALARILDSMHQKRSISPSISLNLHLFMTANQPSLNSLACISKSIGSSRMIECLGLELTFLDDENGKKYRQIVSDCITDRLGRLRRLRVRSNVATPQTDIALVNALNRLPHPVHELSVTPYNSYTLISTVDGDLCRCLRRLTLPLTGTDAIGLYGLLAGRCVTLHRCSVVFTRDQLRELDHDDLRVIVRMFCTPERRAAMACLEDAESRDHRFVELGELWTCRVRRDEFLAAAVECDYVSSDSVPNGSFTTRETIIRYDDFENGDEYFLAFRSDL